MIGSYKASCIFEITQTLENSQSAFCQWIMQDSRRLPQWVLYLVESRRTRQAQEETGPTGRDLILTAFKRRGYKKGARSIYAELIHLDPPVIMNVKDTAADEKFHLICPIRKEKPCQQLARILRTSHTADNLLRQFEEYGPRMVLLTDTNVSSL